MNGPGSGTRACACGCGTSLAGRDYRARYVDAAHRARHWRESNGYTRRARERGRQVRLNGLSTPSSPSGLQLSYWKAVRTLAQELEQLGVRDPETHARLVLAQALPDRQRTRLHQKEAA